MRVLINGTGATSQKARPFSGIDVPAGAILFDDNNPSRNIFLLRSGRVQLWSGRDAVLDYLVPGDFFGLQSILRGQATDQRARVQTARVLSSAKISVFSKASLLNQIQQDRRFAMRFVRNVATRMDRFEAATRDFVTEPAESRLARLFLRLAPAGATSGWVRLLFSPSNSQLAKTIGTTRSRVSHFMSRFQQLGWLRRRPDLWINYEGLRAFVETPEPTPSGGMDRGGQF
jgi:CRP-like cAMP-binding protein